MSQAKRVVGWLIPYFIALAITIVFFWGLRVWWVGPLERDCRMHGGHRVQHVSTFLCADREGRIIEIDHPR